MDKVGENVGLSNANNSENPVLRNPKGSSTRFLHKGWVRAYDQAKRSTRWTIGEYPYTTLCWSRGIEEVRFAEKIVIGSSKQGDPTFLG